MSSVGPGMVHLYNKCYVDAAAANAANRIIRLRPATVRVGRSTTRHADVFHYRHIDVIVSMRTGGPHSPNEAGLDPGQWIEAR